MRLKPLLAAVLVVAAAAPFAAQATLYKWVDERGVVNYGDTPPAGAKKAIELDESTSSLSVVPGLSKEELAQIRERDAQARVERLERDVAELRARPVAPPMPVYDTQAIGYLPTYVPLVATRRSPPRQAHFPVRRDPVKKTPPFSAMKLER